MHCIDKMCTLTNCKPTLILVVKQIKTINAGKSRIAALEAERDAILAYFGARQPAFAFA